MRCIFIMLLGSLSEVIMTKQQKVKTTEAVLCILAFIAFAAIVFCVPYFKDDWAWGSQIGIDRLKSGFADYNGRYLGNLLIIALTRVPVIRIIVMAAGAFLLTFLTARIVDKRIALLFPLELAMVFAMPDDLFRQTVVWTSGFANYVPPVLISLAYILIIKDIVDKEPPKYSFAAVAGLFVMGVCGALFMEHVTVYNVLLGFAVLVFTQVKYKKICAGHVSFALGACAGAVIMLTNSSYGFISSGQDHYEYRSFAVGGTISKYFATIGANMEKITDYFLECNAILNIALAVLACIVIHRFYKKNNVTKGKKFWLNVSAGFCVAYAVFCTVISVIDNINKNTYARDSIHFGWRFAFTLLFTAALLIIICIAVTDKRARARMLFTVVSSYAFVTPLFFVTPITARCFLPCYAMMMILAGLLFKQVWDETENKEKAAKTAFCAIMVCVVLLGVYLSTVFVTIRNFTVEREEYIAAQIEDGKKEVILPQYPAYSSGYISGSTPGDGTIWEERFKAFYHIDEDIDLIIIGNKKYESMK